MRLPTTAHTIAAPRLRLLGAPRFELADGTSHALERRTAALLALLALQGAMPRARAAALVWPEVDEQHANNSLRQRIFKLRQLVGRDVITSDKLIALADDITHDLHSPRQRLTNDPESCQGDLLGAQDYADCAELDEWVNVARQRWRSEMGRALAELASHHEGEARIATALRLSERLVELEPVQEHAHRRVMRLHYLRGDGAAALAAFDRCRLLLKSELGVLPDRETQELQRLIESSQLPVARAAMPHTVATLRPPRLVGREAEWRLLEQTLTQGRTVLVIGEAGIGKTRLLADFVTAHGGILARARPGDASVPHATVARMLRLVIEHRGTPPADGVTEDLARILPELGTPPPGPADPLRLRLAIERLLQAASTQGPMLVGLDDLHFADVASLEMLPGLTQSGGAAASGSPEGGWLLASRPADLPGSIAAWSRAQDADAPATLTLGTLDLAAIEALIDSLGLPGLDTAAWAIAIFRHTGGNPMFILETLRSVLASGQAPPMRPGATLPSPADVGRLIEQRLLQLPPRALNLARVAALAGQDFTPELAAHVLAAGLVELADPWRQLEDAQVIREQAFAHDLILEATRRGIPMPIGAALHRSIATYLERAEAPAARIAAHWHDAAEPSRAGEQYIRAAEQARQSGSKELECGHHLAAAASFEQAGLRDLCFEALRRGLDAIVAVRPLTEAQVIAEKLETLASNPRQRADALFAAQFIDFVKGANEAAHSTGESVIRLARDAGARDIEFQSLRLQASALARLGRPQEAVGLFDAARAMSAQTGTATDHAQLLAETANCIELVGRRSESIQLRDQALALFAELGNWSDRQQCLNSQAAALGQLGRFGDALAAVELANRMIERVAQGNALHIGFSAATAGVLAGQAGEFGVSLASFDRALACFDEAGYAMQRVATENLLAPVLITLGQYGRAQKLISGPAVAADPRHAARREAMMSRLQRSLGQPARAHAARALQLLRAAGHPASVNFLVELEASREDEPVEALARCREIEARAEHGEFLGFALHARVRQVDCLRAVDPEQAAHAALHLVEESRVRLPSDMYPPELWWVACLALGAQGRQPQALAALRTARDWILDFALPRVPQSFRASFQTRNAVNVAVLSAAKGLD